MIDEQRPERRTRLRRRTEGKLDSCPRDTVVRSGHDLQRLVRELEVRQIELELQNAELRQAHSKLETSYDELYDFAPVGYFTLTRDGSIAKTNLAGAALMGLPRDEVMRRSFAGFLLGDSRPGFGEFLGRVFRGAGKQCCMLTLMKSGETPVTVYMEADSVGQVEVCRAVAVDVTSSEQSKLELRESEEHLRLALAASGMGIWEWDCDSGDMYCSLECFKIVGIDCFCPNLSSLRKLVHPEDVDRIKSAARQALQEGKEIALECRILRPNGEIAWLFLRGQVRCSRSGKPLRILGVVQDITEQKQPATTVA